MVFRSILWRVGGGLGTRRDPPDHFRDLGLDLVVRELVKGREGFGLEELFYSPPEHLEDAVYRQSVFADLEDEVLLGAIKRFSDTMRIVLAMVGEAEEHMYEYQREGVFVGAVLTYCRAVEGLLEALLSRKPASEGLCGLAEYLGSYVSSERFRSLRFRAEAVAKELCSTSFCMTIKNGTITVYRCEGDAEDYAVEVERLFERFAEGGVKDEFGWRLTKVRGHVEAAVLAMAAKLFPHTFGHLVEFYRANRNFLDEVVVRFYREVQFYLAYLDYIAPLRALGLKFCLPQLTLGGGGYNCYGGFDIALASKLAREGGRPVANDFELVGDERIVVVTGPNSGGKTTFARMVGQLHYLAKLGVPVPGTQAKLLFCDNIYTHFPTREDVENLKSKLEGDLLKIRRILERATPRSLIVINEMLGSTSVADAAKIGRRIIGKIRALGSLCVFVTFVHELATLEGVVSYVAQVDPRDLETRTFRVVRAAPTGLAHALSLAKKHRLTYEDISERIRR